MTDVIILGSYVYLLLFVYSFGVAGCNEKLVETKTKEIYDFLSMLRSASGDNSAGSSTSRSDWKVSYGCHVFFPFQLLI